MRKFTIGMSAAALLAFAAAAPAQQSGTQAGSSSTSQAATHDSLAAASRRAKEQKAKSSEKPAKVYTNENLPSASPISTVGASVSSSSDQESSSSSGATTGATKGATNGGQGEAAWRARFQALRSKLSQDQSELDVMQREAGNLNLQNYSDPVKGMQQGLSRDDINKKTAEIDAKKKQIAEDQQAISDAEDDLRKAGGNPGWAR